jgi:hypothetical protein
MALQVHLAVAEACMQQAVAALLLLLLLLLVVQVDNAAVAGAGQLLVVL